jgi:hypothetical protein
MASPLNLTISAASKFATNPNNGTVTNTSNGTQNNQELQYQTNGAYTNSLFGDTSTNENQIAFYPTALKDGTDQQVVASKLGTIHSDDINDTSIGSLISYTEKYNAMKLKAIDFAYLKQVGVFPNNRLMVARRFRQPVGDDLTTYTGNPIATLLSWAPEDTDFLEIKYGEEWMDAEADLTSILNDMTGGEGGTNAAGGFGAIPLPGFTEALQYKVMKSLGLTDVESENLPSGNPNLIRQAKRRATVDKTKPGSGLKATVSIKMAVEFEQKFIAGVDPTMSWMDIVANALSFGTSNSEFQFKGAVSDSIKNLLDKLSKGKIEEAITDFLTSIINAISDVGKQLITDLTNVNASTDAQPDPTALLEKALAPLRTITAGVISKYKVRIIGIVNAITGQPSTPWHITIGNPKKPIFSSGDMLVEDVTMYLGPTLAFNDLPSSIRLEFTMTNARPLGKQEIFRKLNTGKGRSYKSAQDVFAKNLLITGTKTNNPLASSGNNGLGGNVNSPNVLAAQGNVPGSGQNGAITNINTGKVTQVGSNAADGASTLAGKDTSAIQGGTTVNPSLTSSPGNPISQINTTTSKVTTGSLGRPSTVFDDTENGGTITSIPTPSRVNP